MQGLPEGRPVRIGADEAGRALQTVRLKIGPVVRHLQ